MSNGQETIQLMIEELLRVANRHKIVIAGFAIAAEPAMVVNFGNCTDCHKYELYEQLCALAEGQREKGLAKKTTVSEVN